jgi:hypothetical protein
VLPVSCREFNVLPPSPRHIGKGAIAYNEYADAQLSVKRANACWHHRPLKHRPELAPAICGRTVYLDDETH